MKKILAILLISIMLTGCGKTSGADETENASAEQAETSMFEIHELDRFYSILVDKQTRVCYLECKCPGGYYGIAPMLNPDGTPKIWEE